MRHRLVIDLPGEESLALIAPFEVGSLGAEIFSHITQICRRMPPFELGPAAVDSLRSALHTGLLWGQTPPAEAAPQSPGTVIACVRMMTEQPDGRWESAHDFELGR